MDRICLFLMISIEILRQNNMGFARILKSKSNNKRVSTLNNYFYKIQKL